VTVVARRDPHCSRDVGARTREADDRSAPTCDTSVARVERQLERLGTRPIGPEDRLQVGKERARVVDHPRLRRKGARESLARGRPSLRSHIMSRRDRTPAGPAREWVTFDDPVEEGRIWQIDVTFLMSSYRCIFGCGCQGIWTAPTPELGHGCCTYGAHFSDKADREHVVKVAKELSADEWQFAKVAKKKGIYEKVVEDEGDGPEWKTTIHKDACIFLNRLDFPAGAGCALHLHALNRGKHFSEYKP